MLGLALFNGHRDACRDKQSDTEHTLPAYSEAYFNVEIFYYPLNLGMGRSCRSTGPFLPPKLLGCRSSLERSLVYGGQCIVDAPNVHRDWQPRSSGMRNPFLSEVQVLFFNVPTHSGD